MLHLWLSRKYLAAYNSIWAWSFGVFMCVLNTCERQTEWKGNVCGVCVHVWPSLNRETEATKDEVVCHFYIRWHLDLCLNFLSVLMSVKNWHLTFFKNRWNKRSKKASHNFVISSSSLMVVCCKYKQTCPFNLATSPLRSAFVGRIKFDLKTSRVFFFFL